MKTALSTLRMSAQFLKQGNTAKAYVYALLSLLLSALIGLGPIGIGVLHAIDGNWTMAFVTPIVLYIVLGLFTAFWPIIAIIYFIGAWRGEGFTYALLTTGAGLAFFFIVLAGPDWLMHLAYKSAERAAEYEESLGTIGRAELTQRQKRVLLLIAEMGSAGTSAVAKELGVSQSTAYRELQMLTDLHLIHSSTSGKRMLTEEGIAVLDNAQGP